MKLRFCHRPSLAWSPGLVPLSARQGEVYKHWQTHMCIHLDERGRVLSRRRLDAFLKYVHDWDVRKIGRP
jgi:hypothetical protein